VFVGQSIWILIDTHLDPGGILHILQDCFACKSRCRLR
jgi:hypothetical protein